MRTRLVALVTRAAPQLAVRRMPALAMPALAACRSAAPAPSAPGRLVLLRPLCVRASTEELSEAYAEARELLEEAEDGKGTTYFESDLEDAREAVDEVIAQYEKQLLELSDTESAQLRASVGLRMEELKGRLALLMDSLIHDED